MTKMQKKKMMDSMVKRTKFKISGSDKSDRVSVIETLTSRESL